MGIEVLPAIRAALCCLTFVLNLLLRTFDGKRAYDPECGRRA